MEKTFIPFMHQDLEIKNELLTYARKLKDDEPWEANLSAAFIYTSFAEYLADHLLCNLRHVVWAGTLSQFAGIIGIDERKSNNKMTMGQLIHQISKYEFPNKAIVTLLNDISELRNNLFHNFVKSNLEELKKVISDDFKTITDKTEELGIQEKNP